MLQVIYLVFNEGYSASSGESLTRADLSGEAIRLARLLNELLPEPEVMGLLALMLLHESRRAARTSPAGDLILLDDQDRSLWNRGQIAEGKALVERALSSRRFGPYTLQAAIAAVHADAETPAATDWAQIVALYDVLAQAHPSPVVELNRAVAVAMRDGPAAGLALIDAILARGDLADYHLAHSARAELCRRLGRTAEARASYERALEPHATGARAALPGRKAARAGGLTWVRAEYVGGCDRWAPCRNDSRWRLPYSVNSISCIMPSSSWFIMWQCSTVLPVKSRKRERKVRLPCRGTMTVSRQSGLGHRLVVDRHDLERVGVDMEDVVAGVVVDDRPLLDRTEANGLVHPLRIEPTAIDQVGKFLVRGGRGNLRFDGRERNGSGAGDLVVVDWREWSLR